MDGYDIAVTTAFGNETVTKSELKKLGFPDAKAFNGTFTLKGTALDVARLNMFLHTAERVFLQIGTFPCPDFDALYDGVKALPWENYLSEDSRIVVNGKTVKSKLLSLSDCQKIIKKAIIDRLKKTLRTSVFAENGAISKVEFALREDEATVYIDTSGAGLHKRGYRNLVGEAPLKETLACGLLLLSDFSADKPLVDPFCGSGTIITEGARMALGIAPGKGRSFHYADWKKFDKTVFNTVLEEAADNEKLRKLDFAGYDADPAAIKLSLRHAKQAGVSDYVHFQVRNVSEFSSAKKYGCIVTNPPYGERLLSAREVEKLYKIFGDVCKKIPDWSINVITSFPQFEKYFGRKCDKNRKFFNAGKECRYYSFVPKK